MMRFLLLLLVAQSASFHVSPPSSFHVSPPSSSHAPLSPHPPSSLSSTRSSFLRTAPFLVAPLLFPPPPSLAISLDELKSLPIEGDVSGGATRLANLEALQAAAIAKDPQLVDVSPGVQYREYKVGGGPAVAEGSRVAAEMTVRCSTVTSTKEPNGVKIYSTLEDDDLGEVLLRTGAGAGTGVLDAALAGMGKGGIRRVYLDSERAYKWRQEGGLPKPRADNKERNKLVDRVFSNKADLIVEVKVNRVK